MTAHAVMVAGLLLGIAGATLAPTNCQKLVATTFGFLLAAAGAHEAGHAWRWSWLQAPLVAFLAASVLSTILSRARKPNMVLPSVTRSDGLLTQSLYIGLALLATQLGGADREIVLEGLLGGTVWVAAVAYWQSLGKAQWALPAGATPAMMDTRVRACGTLANPLFLGGYCAMLLPIATWRAAHAGATADYIAAGLLAFTALLSGARSAWVGLAVGLPLALWGAPPHWPETVFGIGAVLSVAAFGRREHLSRAGWKDVLHDTIHSTQSGRRYIWGETWRQIIQRPIFGYGPNQMTVKNPDPAANDFFDRAHQVLLDVAHPFGFVGLACYATMWIVALVHAGPFLPGFIAYGLWSMAAFPHLGVDNMWYGIVGLTIAGTITL